MRIVFFTDAAFERREFFRYMYACVASRFPDVHIVAVERRRRGGIARTFRRYRRKVRRLGLLRSLEIFTSFPIRRALIRRDRSLIREMLLAIPRPAVDPDPAAAVRVPTANGPEAVDAITGLEPDVLIQSGAGILRSRIFSIARLGTLNIHHGIAPLIRGMSSIDWALLEQRPEWIGATIHMIDEGIDTGPVLAYVPVERERPGEGFPRLYVRSTREAVAKLIDVLERLERGDVWSVDPPPGRREYRSSFSGWRHLAVELALFLERRAARRGARDVRRSETR